MIDSAAPEAVRHRERAGPRGPAALRGELLTEESACYVSAGPCGVRAFPQED
jgi:hypothetical protein